MEVVLCLILGRIDVDDEKSKNFERSNEDLVGTPQLLASLHWAQAQRFLP
jgi:hypothetical protein